MDDRQTAQIEVLLSEIWRLSRTKRRIAVAIDGRCGSGKTTLAQELETRLDSAAVMSMDDFFLPLNLRTPERLAEPGGNIHYERFLAEAAGGIRAGGGFTYRVFDCARMDYTGRRHVADRRVILVEGTYSLHPKFAGLFDVKLFTTCSPGLQRQRLAGREGPEGLERFVSEWIPMEERYFSAYAIPAGCDFVLDTGDGMGQSHQI